MNKFHILIGVVCFDTLITLFGVGYLGAIELNLLCFNFIYFMIIKLIASGVCLFGIFKMERNRFVDGCVLLLIIFYTLVGIGNIWATANYLYY